MTEKMKKFHRFTPDEINALPGREVKSKRTRASKTYALGNGLYQAVIYPEDIHYRNAKGEWEDINHTLEQENGCYCDHSGDLSVKLATSGAVTLTKGDHMLSWQIIGASAAEAQVDNAQPNFPRHNKRHRLENKVTYANIFPDVDFVCEVKPGCFKDTLVFKNEASLRPVEFLIHAENVVLRQSAGGAVVAMCGEDTIFRLPAPCVADENGDIIPDSAHAVLTKISECEWLWICEVNADFATSASYPIHLDPVVETQQSRAAMSMAYTSSKKPDTNFPATGYSTLIANNDSTYGKCRTFLRFHDRGDFEKEPEDENTEAPALTEEEISAMAALPPIDSSFYVTSATMTMCTAYDGGATAVYVKEVLAPWAQDEIVYSNCPKVADEALEYYVAPSTKNKYLYFNITNLVRKWYNHPEQNFGLMLETTASSTVKLCAAGSTYHKPYITINYVSLAGMESYLPQDSISCGRAGTAHVGLFNGNLVLSHQETSTNGNLMPVSISRFYNSCYHDDDSFHAGMGWKFSTQHTLHKEVIDSTTYYVYTDGDGTRHFFKKQDGDWKDLSGLQLELTLDTDQKEAIITDKSDAKKYFPLPENEYIAENEDSQNDVKWMTSVADARKNAATYLRAKYETVLADETTGTEAHDIMVSGSFKIATDAASRSTEAEMNDDMHIVRITAPDMNAVEYEYDDQNRLIQITHSDGKQTKYTYNGNGLLESIANVDPQGHDVTAQSPDNTQLVITYHAQKPYRVAQITMLANHRIYAARKYEYGDCCTTVTDLAPINVGQTVDALKADLINGTMFYGNDDPTQRKALHYHFNDAGNLVSVNDDLGYGYFAGYSDDSPANHPDYTSKLQRSVNNYLINHHFITVNDSWTVEKKDSGTGNCGYSSDNNYIGGRAYKLQKTNAVGQIGVYQTVKLKDGADYTFSCQYRTEDEGEVQLQVAFPGVSKRETSPALRSTSRWNRTHVTFTVPKNSAETETTYTDVSVYITAVNGIGTVWADAAQVEDGKVPNRYNLLVNGNFYMNDSGRPLHWSMSDTAEDNDGASTDIAAGRPTELTGNVARFYGKPSTEKYIYQNVPSILRAGDTLVAGGWAWSHCRPRNEEKNSIYEMEILGRRKLSDMPSSFTGTTPPFETIGRVRWSEEWSGWQFAAVPIVLKYGYTDFRVKLVYRNNLNEAQFSNLFLHKEEFGKTYAYDSKGNITSVKNLAALSSDSDYDDFDNLTSYCQPGRTEKYTMNWGSDNETKQRHLLRKTTSPLKIIQRTVYDEDIPEGTENGVETAPKNPNPPRTENGLPRESYVESTAKDNNGNTCSLFIASKTEYTENNNYVAKTTDARGKSVTTDTDENRGIVNSVTDPKGQTVCYEYDNLNRVTEVKTTVTEDDIDKNYVNKYEYAGDKLVAVRHNTSADTADDVVYHFTYDDQNRRTQVKVGDQLLSENEYDDTPGDTYGTLSHMKYGNGDVVSYGYDEFKRTTSIQYGKETTGDDGNAIITPDPQKLFTFEYGANGRVARVYNKELDRIVLSEVDKCDRPMRITQMEAGNHVYTGEATYDAHSNLASFEEMLGNGRTFYSTQFTYDAENKPAKMVYHDAASAANSELNKVAYTYDALGRTEKRTVTLDGAPFDTTYGYVSGGHTYIGENRVRDNSKVSTTGLIASITQPGGNFTYTYDDNGNITSVVQDGKTTSYTYDTLGQLIQVDDEQENATWVYEYDQGGNILSKRKYALGVTSGTVSESKTFTYGNANWKDQLTAVNGTPITYDNIGNPTNDGTWTYTWEKGRQLKRMIKSGETVEFKYNENGLRIQKVATSTGTTNYTLHGKNIVHMTRGSNSLHFFYDASNKPAIVEFNGTKYAYVHNLQGDIVAILDSNGNNVVEYKYDAWGKPFTPTGSMATSLGELNPFRYRGYVYDEETELYYLRSRYYSVHHYRFVNSDGIITRNMYAYCSNKPVILKDKTGYAPTSNKFSVCMYDDGGSVVDNIGNSLDTPYAKEGDGNYYRHDRDDLYFEHAELHHNISKEDVQKWYNSLSRDDYPTAGLVLSILPIPSWISFLSELFSLGDDMSPNATTDPQGNVLYIEEGYSIVELRRVYRGDGYSATETEYFVYNLDDNLVFNTTIRDTYFTD